MNKVFEPYLQKIEDSLNFFLPEETNSDWQDFSFSLLKKCTTNEHISNLTKPCLSLVKLGGKRWRPLLMILCAELCEQAKQKNVLKKDELYSLCSLVEFVHTASLIHDDIEDGADFRRGKPATHITYGLDTALNAASWLYFEAATCIQKLNTDSQLKNTLYELYLLELRRLHLGQAMDIYWHRNKMLFPTEEEYFQMVQCKTGTLASLACQVGFIAGGATQKEAKLASQIAALLGQGFQILDDVQNLTTGNPGKKRGDDIVEGKKSLPILIHVNQNPNDKQKIANLFEKAQNQGIESSAIEECIAILENSGSIQKAKQIGKDCINQNVAKLSNFFEKEDLKASKLIKILFEEM